jgi:hypothetical protein
VTEVSLRGRGIFRASVIAVLFACLLGALIYYLPLEGVIPQSAIGFVWATGEDSPTESEYNVCLERVFFEVKFYFANGTGVSIPAIFPPYLSTGPTRPEDHRPEYHGEIDATSLTTIGARFIQFGVKRPGDAIATMEIHENRFVNVYLVSGGVTTGMGMHEYLNENNNVWFNQTHTHIYGNGTYETSTNTGYFVERYRTNVPTWNITVNELSQMLPYTGTATIDFHTSLEVNVHYNITINGETKIGDTKLTWNGILGTYQLNLDQGRILSVKYDFMSVFLFLKIEK